MIRNRGTFGGPSKALPTTLEADRTLRHYSYECKAANQERPYKSRPSRTQQLANPKLVPQLTSDVPNELLRKKGIADEQLAKAQAERGRKRALNENTPPRRYSRNSRSSSFSSVSTISTNLSRSISPKRSKRSHQYERVPRTSRNQSGRKRRRSSSTSASSSYSSYSSSPSNRGPSTHQPRDRDRNTRRRHSSVSPRPRGRDRHSGTSRRMSHRSRSRSNSMDRSRIARNRNSMTPDLRSSRDWKNGKRGSMCGRERDRRYSNTDDDDRYGGGRRRSGPRDDFKRESPAAMRKKSPPTPEVKRQRSLSPFSKRLALTKAMNMGR